MMNNGASGLLQLLLGNGLGAANQRRNTLDPMELIAEQMQAQIGAGAEGTQQSSVPAEEAAPVQGGTALPDPRQAAAAPQPTVAEKVKAGTPKDLGPDEVDPLEEQLGLKKWGQMTGKEKIQHVLMALAQAAAVYASPEPGVALTNMINSQKEQKALLAQMKTRRNERNEDREFQREQLESDQQMRERMAIMENELRKDTMLFQHGLTEEEAATAFANTTELEEMRNSWRVDEREDEQQHATEMQSRSMKFESEENAKGRSHQAAMQGQEIGARFALAREERAAEIAQQRENAVRSVHMDIASVTGETTFSRKAAEAVVDGDYSKLTDAEKELFKSYAKVSRVKNAKDEETIMAEFMAKDIKIPLGTVDPHTKEFIPEVDPTSQKPLTRLATMQEKAQLFLNPGSLHNVAQQGAADTGGNPQNIQDVKSATPAQARQAVDELIEMGYDVEKIEDTLKNEPFSKEARAAINAKLKGLRSVRNRNSIAKIQASRSSLPLRNPYGEDQDADPFK